MGLASSVPANATAGQFPAMYQAPRSQAQDGSDTYTDKNYVDTNFVTRDNFNQFHTNYKDNVIDANKDGSWAYAKVGIPAADAQFSKYTPISTWNTFKGDDTRKLSELASKTALTGFITKDVNNLTNYTTTIEANKLYAPITSYNTLSNFYIKEDAGKLCHYSKNNNQRELCIDGSGKLYLQGLGINDTDPTQDQDVYTYIVNQNTAYWNARGTLAAPTLYGYSPINGISQITTSFGTVTLPTPTITPDTTTNLTQGSFTVRNHNITYSGTANWTNISPSNLPFTTSRLPTATSIINSITNNRGLFKVKLSETEAVAQIGGTTVTYTQQTFTYDRDFTVTISNITPTSFTYTFSFRTNPIISVAIAPGSATSFTYNVSVL